MRITPQNYDHVVNTLLPALRTVNAKADITKLEKQIAAFNERGSGSPLLSAWLEKNVEVADAVSVVASKLESGKAKQVFTAPYGDCTVTVTVKRLDNRY